MMSWTIDKDYFDGESVGVRGFGLEVTAGTKDRKRYHLRDDDGNLLASGWLVEDHECPHFHDAWESALEYGLHNWGCTSISDGRNRTVIG